MASAGSDGLVGFAAGVGGVLGGAPMTSAWGSFQTVAGVREPLPPNDSHGRGDDDAGGAPFAPGSSGTRLFMAGHAVDVPGPDGRAGAGL